MRHQHQEPGKGGWARGPPPWLGGAWQGGLQGHSWALFPVMAWQASVTKVGLLAPLGLACVAVKPKAGLEVGEEPIGVGWGGGCQSPGKP